MKSTVPGKPPIEAKWAAAPDWTCSSMTRASTSRVTTSDEPVPGCTTPRANITIVSTRSPSATPVEATSRRRN